MHIFVQLLSKLAMSCNQPPAECVPGALSPYIKFAQCEAGRSLPSSAHVRNANLHFPIYASKECRGTTFISLNFNFMSLRGQ